MAQIRFWQFMLYFVTVTLTQLPFKNILSYSANTKLNLILIHQNANYIESS